MLYKITVATFDAPIPTAPNSPQKYAPWSNSFQPVSFADATLSEIEISDDDSFIEIGLYSPEETEQRLTADATFGFGATTETVEAGTQLSNNIGSVMVAPPRINDAGEEVIDRFVMMFPLTFVPNEFGEELGGRHSVLILPVPRDEGGEQVFPTFDPTLSYAYSGNQSISSTDDNTPYGPTCFAQGTLIRTAGGPKPVEDLQPGDLLATLDHGLQPILWVGSRLVDEAHLDLRPQDRPVLIRAGALGQAQPLRDMMVSPQHRVLVRSPIAARMLGGHEALVAARHLVGQPGISVRRDLASIRYWHILLDRHEVVESEGAWTESLYPGPMALRGFTQEQQRQIRAAMPDLDGTALPFARPVPKGRQARQLSARHMRNGKPLVEQDRPADQSPTSARANSSGSNASRSSICSPTPMA